MIDRYYITYLYAKYIYYLFAVGVESSLINVRRKLRLVLQIYVISFKRVTSV